MRRHRRRDFTAFVPKRIPENLARGMPARTQAANRTKFLFLTERDLLGGGADVRRFQITVNNSRAVRHAQRRRNFVRP
jgi:hypothetical protein